jgi:N-acetyl-1-D-myo-inositol-2-amino-2-deoxy-alpha-D-glucopyranoside deacetylase
VGLVWDAMSPELLGGARRVLFVHAHPDDETLATGGLIAALAEHGVDVFLLTATRGEQGEIVPGSFAVPGAVPGVPLDAEQAEALARHRVAEVQEAARTLGVRHGAFLGDAGARAAGRAPRRYTDSGMVWLDDAETLAGPGPDAGPDALSRAEPAEIAHDIAAYATDQGADALVSYDDHGGYGHPDHIALHTPVAEASRLLGIPFWEVASHSDVPGEHIDATAQLDRVKAALAHHATQLTVDGDEVVHVGGQRQPIATRFTLRRV